MGLMGLIRAYYGGLQGILSGLTKSTDHPSREHVVLGPSGNVAILASPNSMPPPRVEETKARLMSSLYSDPLKGI